MDDDTSTVDAAVVGARRSLTMTDDLLRAMTRDVTTLVLWTRRSRVVLAVLAVLLGSALVPLARSGYATAVVPVVAGGAGGAAVLVPLTRRSARRALRVAMPPGREFAVAVTDDALVQDGVLGTSRTAWVAYQDLRVRGASAVLRLKGSAAFAVIPSALLTDADQTRIRQNLG